MAGLCSFSAAVRLGDLGCAPARVEACAPRGGVTASPFGQCAHTARFALGFHIAAVCACKSQHGRTIVRAPARRNGCAELVAPRRSGNRSAWRFAGNADREHCV
jgi:hypothetical protein